MSSRKDPKHFYRKVMGRALKTAKKQGVRSIQDIISTDRMSFPNKIAYIRHHYVYYEGNYDLFHDENGKPTETKRLLDDVIIGIVRGNLDPSELTSINKEILNLRKERDKEAELKHQKELDVYIQQNQNNTVIEPKPQVVPVIENTLPGYKKKLNLKTAAPYIQIIDEYLDTLSLAERTKIANTWNYKDLKRVAKWWALNNRPSLLAEAIAERNTQEQATADLLRGYKKYAEENWKNTSTESND